MAEPQNVQKELKKKRGKELLDYFGQMVKKEGLFATVRRTGQYVKRRYGRKKGRFLPLAKTLASQRESNVSTWPSISICVPVFDPNPEFFAQLLASVQQQSYANWQLCLADASADEHGVRSMVEALADERISYVKIANEGIAKNTNEAAKLAKGDFIALLDHDDVLGPSALFEMAKAANKTGAKFLYSDEALFVTTPKSAGVGHFKPDYSPQYLLNVNYITHLVIICRKLFEQLGGMRAGFDGSQDHDLFLRVLEKTGTAVHVPKVLYFWRQHAGSTSMGVQAKPYVQQAAICAIDEHLQRIGILGKARKGTFDSTYKVDYEVVGSPLVSIIIPSHEHAEDLRLCVESIYGKTSYANFEVIVVENNSTKAETFALYEEMQSAHKNCRVETYVPKPNESFNFSSLCNFGRQKACGEYLLFLNNDTELISANWLEEMLGLCALPKVGIVGAMLYYPDDTVQHAGVILGLGGFAGHSHKYALRGKSGYMFRQACVQELSAVTGACLLCKTAVFDEIEGFDEGFSVAYNDVDFCLRARKLGYSVLFTPYAELYHHESKSRGLDEQGEAKARFETEKARMKERYGMQLLHDEFYSPSLTLDREDFSENDVLAEV